MNDNVPPEERLLRLIRGPKQSRVPVLTGAAPDALIGGGSQDSPVHQKQAFKLERYLPKLNANILILLGLFSSLVYLIYVFTYPLFINNKNISLQSTPFNKAASPNEAVKNDGIKSYDYYSQGIKIKPIFGAAPAQSTQEPSVMVGTELMKEINLLGVISGANPQAVIEDKKSGKTYYVTEGQMIGDFQVEEIGDGKIILNYNGQKFELNI